MGRERRVGGEWVLLGALVGIAIVLAGAFWLTQTDRGRARVLAITLDALAPNVQGTLRVGRIEGNLLSGARLYDVELRALDGEPLLLADSAFVNYGLRSLTVGDIEIHELVVWDGLVVLRRMPNDTLWNFQKVFRDTVDVDDPTEARAVVIHRMQLTSVELRIQTPWEPDPDLHRDARDWQIAEALADTVRLVVEEVPGGFLRTERYEIDHADIPLALIAPDERGGIALRVEQLTGRLYMWRDAAYLERARLMLTFVNDRLEIHAETLRFPDSELTISGVFLFNEETEINLSVETPGAALRDLRWLYPPLPREGYVRGRLLIETRPDGMLYWVRDLALEAPGTQIVGNFGMIVDDSVQFIDVDLVADPLRVETVEAMLPTELPVRGLHIGALEIRPAT
jgi:hypothetical protein